MYESMSQASPAARVDTAVDRPVGSWWTYAVPFVIGFVAVVRIAFTLDPHVNGRDFMHNGWIPARLILAGQNPYAPEQSLIPALAGDYYSTLLEEGTGLYNTGATYNAVYPYWAMLLQLPLGRLDFGVALRVWTVVSGALLVASIILVLAAMRNVADLRVTGCRWTFVCAAVTLIGVVFMPTMLHFALGQYSIVVLFALAVLFRRTAGTLANGAAFALLTIKPQLSGLAAALIALAWLARRSRGAWWALATAGLLHVAPTLVLRDAVTDWFRVNFLVQRQAFRIIPVSSSWWGVAYHCREWLGTGWWPMAAALCVMTVLPLKSVWGRVWNGEDWRHALPLTLIVTLLVTPYTIAYDQVLLLLPAIYLWTQLLVQDTPRAKLLGIALLVWATVLPTALLFAMRVASNNYVKVWQTITLLILWTVADTVSAHHRPRPAVL